MLKWPAMNERERKQLETKLRNRMAELDAELDAFRALHPVFRHSDADFEEGKVLREELDLIASLSVKFAQSVMAAAAAVSLSRSTFEVSKNAIDQMKARMALVSSDLTQQLNRIQPARENELANCRAVQNAEKALTRIEQIIVEAEFDFAARTTRIGKRPTDDLIDQAIRSCASGNMDNAFDEIRDRPEFLSLTRDTFRERWRIVRDNPTVGRPPSKPRIR